MSKKQLSRSDLGALLVGNASAAEAFKKRQQVSPVQKKRLKAAAKKGQLGHRAMPLHGKGKRCR
jgi:hypothetical protein